MSITKTYRLHVDPDKCQGHNRCKAIAPDLFVLDEYGNAREAGNGQVLEESMERARLAQKNCPEFAIRLGTVS